MVSILDQKKPWPFQHSESKQRVISRSSIVIHVFNYAVVTAASSASAGPHFIDAKTGASGCPQFT